MAAWHRYLSGTQSTASTLDDLKAYDAPPGGDLVVINLNGQERVLAHNVNTPEWQPSPARTAVAFTRKAKAIPKPPKYLNMLISERGEWRLNVVTIDGRRIATAGDRAREVIPSSLRWSPDGQSLAYLGYASGVQIAPSLYLLNMRTERVKAIVLNGLNMSPWGGHYPNPMAGDGPPGLTWTNTGALLVRGARMPGTAQGNSTSSIRKDWWLISPEGARRCLTCRLSSVPMSLWPERGRNCFFGIAAGRLLELDVSSGDIIDLTAQLHGSVAALISPTPQSSLPFVGSNRDVMPRTYAYAVLLLKHKQTIEPHLLDLSSRLVTTLLAPAKRANAVSVGPDGKTILYLQDDRSGLFLWRSNTHSRESEVLFSGNAFLNGIAEGRLSHFAYTSLDGTKLIAWILLPPGYRSGRRYPMISFIYPTDSFSAPAIPMEINDELSTESVFNMQIAAAHGYAVLFPSIPVAYRDRNQVGLKVVNGVLPAVAAAVRRGFADPHRLAVWGQSYGGEAVMDLVTRTNLFQAAIASAGSSDLISEYGALNAENRYSKWDEEDVTSQVILESGELNLGGPPWKEWFRYVENSPIFSVDRVHTPLLLTAGDLDFIPMQQSEEFYRALVRQGKPARLVRYWGEGHKLANPANIRDYWRQVFRWLNRYLPPASQKR
jgi:dipeptidyl aminopeptidase/acylaminoacyl peptidase